MWCVSWIIKSLDVIDARCKLEDYLGLVKATLKMHCSVRVWVMYGLCDQQRHVKVEVIVGERMKIEEDRWKKTRIWTKLTCL